MGHASTPLKTANTSSRNTLQIFTISHLPPGGYVLGTGLTFDPVQNVIVRTQGLVYVRKRWHNPQPLSSGWMISLRGSSYEIHHTSTRRRSSPSGTFWPPTKRMGTLSLSSL